MDWVKLVFDLLTGGAGAASMGGLFGILGSALGSWLKMKQQKQEFEFEAKKWDHEYKLQELSMKSRQEENEQAIALAATQGSWNALAASYHLERKAGESYKWVNAIKDLFRPLVTVLLIVAVLILFFELRALLNGQQSGLSGAVSIQEALEMIKYLVYSVVFTFSTAVLWWYGDRAFAPPGMKNR